MAIMQVSTERTLAKYIAGQVYYYPAFQSVIHGEKLSHELRKDLTRETAREAWIICIAEILSN
ncbi:protein transporter Sec24-plant-like protein, putative [Medicago truncatula]|uniref:Protein transporter Sec24-plant-like protein, putative n=1 Tax=Medicago truncatula TaxID=3880 RepID=A0A072TU97_MEDTR|nr:protein transporter Sec24-plant-like protein, putative [Medicago truncatula]